jgi:hypothetical protein
MYFLRILTTAIQTGFDITFMHEIKKDYLPVIDHTMTRAVPQAASDVRPEGAQVFAILKD